MSNCRSPITLGGKALRNGAMLVSAELRGVEQLIVASVTSADGAPGDAEADHYRDNQQGEQNAEGQPSTWHGRAFFNKAKQQVVDPFMHPLAQGRFGIDRFVEFALGGLVWGIVVDVDGGHAQLVLTPAASARGSRWKQSSRLRRRRRSARPDRMPRRGSDGPCTAGPRRRR